MRRIKIVLSTIIEAFFTYILITIVGIIAGIKLLLGLLREETIDIYHKHRRKSCKKYPHVMMENIKLPLPEYQTQELCKYCFRLIDV